MTADATLLLVVAAQVVDMETLEQRLWPMAVIQLGLIIGGRVTIMIAVIIGINPWNKHHCPRVAVQRVAC